MSSHGLARTKLLSPFLFLRLRFEERRRYCLAAAVIGVGFAAVCNYTHPDLMGPNGLLEDIKLFAMTVFPFFVVALVAVATFAHPGLDNLPSGSQITLARKGEALVYLKRRQFVCAIFSYCAAVSLTIFLIVVIAKVIHPWLLIPLLSDSALFRTACIAGIATAFAHMVIITFWGLYYLADRLHS